MVVSGKNIVPLNEEEQEFATKNHNIIYDYLHRNGLPMEEYYGLACIGYVRAAADYCRRADLRRYAFTTVAWRKIWTEVGNYQDHARRKGAGLASIDREVTDSGKNLEDVLGETPPQFQQAEFWADLDRILDPEEYSLCRMLAMGYTAAQTGLTRRAFSQRKKKIREKLLEQWCCTGATADKWQKGGWNGRG